MLHQLPIKLLDMETQVGPGILASNLPSAELFQDLLLRLAKSCPVVDLTTGRYQNKPAAQAAGQTLPSTSRQNPPFQQNRRNF